MPPAFLESEYRDRLARARNLLRDQGLDGCICIAPELLYYFAGHEAYTFFSDQALIFTTGDDEPSLVIREVDRARVPGDGLDQRLPHLPLRQG